MKKVTLYSMENCPFCVRAEHLLNNRKIAFKKILLSYDEREKWDELEKRSGMKTMPQIFVEDKCIGGFTELSELDNRGELEKLLTK